MALFHLAFPVTDLVATKAFFQDMLGCTLGRESDRWVDIDFHGHQISAHLVDDMPTLATNPVDGKTVPTQHFGLVLDWDGWHALAERLRSRGVDFLIGPHVRFRGEPGEQATLFIRDPSGNALEFKAFRQADDLFRRA